MIRPTVLTAALAFALAAAPATSKPEATVTIGPIVSEGNCTLYQGVDVRRDVRASPWYYASHTTWTTWFYKDCEDHFAGIKNALAAAFASSGKIAVGGGGYTVSGRVSGVSGGGPAPTTPQTGPGGYAVSSSSMMVEMDVTVKDRTGRVVYGALVSKKVETGSDVRVGGFHATSSMSGEAVYGLVQREVALAVARKVAFKLAPMTVTAINGKSIQLNYGSPFLTMGMLVDVTSPDGGTSVRYRVTSASNQTALAEPYSDGDISRIVPGSQGIAIESDSPEANGRRFQKVDLP
jgi:hypothetical protein